MRFGLTVLTLFLTSISASAQSNYETRALLPILLGPTPGGYGSLWTAKAWVTNNGPTDALLVYYACPFVCPAQLVIPPGRTLEISPIDGTEPGWFVFANALTM